MSYLLDTCIVSEIVRTRPKHSVLSWLAETPEELLYVSVITLGEIEKGIAKLQASRKRERIRSWLDQDLARRFVGRVLPIDQRVAVRWGQLQSEAARMGHPLPVIGALLAATALVHDLTLVTRNVLHFEIPGLSIFDPWNP